MDYGKFMALVRAYGDSEKELRICNLTEYDKKSEIMIANYKKICEIAIKLDFSKI